jgi:glycosyltransferase involved in cell wall biosynthesis
VKILVVHSELGVLRGGGENFTRNLFLAFAERGHDVSATFIADSHGRYPIQMPPKIKPIPITGRWSRNLGQETLSNVARWLPVGTRLRGGWDRIQDAISWRTVQWHDRRFTRRIQMEFNGRWSEFHAVYVHGSVQLAAQVACHRPTILRLPGPVSPELARVLESVQVVCANGDALTQIKKFLGNHVVELPVGIDAEVFKPGPSEIRQRLGWYRNDWVIGYVGRLAYIKGIDLLADAFPKILKIIPHAKLLIVGSGTEKGKVCNQLRYEIARGYVHIEPDIPNHLLPEWYRAMDLFVMPSRYENHSNAVIEAQACGVPFLVSNVAGNQRLAETKGGWLFANGSADSLVHAIRSIAEDPCLAKDRGVLGGEKVRHLYSWQTSAHQLENILQSCLDMKIGIACRP